MENKNEEEIKKVSDEEAKKVVSVPKKKKKVWLNKYIIQILLVVNHMMN